MKNIVAKPIHIGADVGKTTFTEIPDRNITDIIIPVIRDDPTRPKNKAFTDLVLPVSWGGGNG